VPTMTLSMSFRPVRIGFLVRKGSLEDVTYAASASTGLWGGLNHVILPVSSEGDSPWCESLISHFSVDVLVPVADEANIGRLVRKHAYLRWPEFNPGSSPLIRPDEGGTVAFSTLDVSVPLSHYWWREGRHEKDSAAIVPRWPSDHPLAAMHAVQFGMLPMGENGLPTLRDAVVAATKAREVELESTTPQADWGEALFPISLTRLGLTHHDSMARFESGVVIGDPFDADHLALFWNLRAAGARVIFVPANDPSSVEHWARAHLRILAETGPRWTPESDPHPLFWRCSSFGGGLDDATIPDVADEVRDLLPPGIAPTIGVLNDGTWHQPSIVNSMPTAEPRSLLTSLDEQFGSLTLTAQLTDRPFSEARVETSRRSQLWAWSLTPYSSWQIPPDFTLRLPYLVDLNEWYARRVVPVNPWGLRVRPGGFDVITNLSEENISIGVVSVDELIARVLQRGGVALKRSSAGVVAQRVIESMGGLRGAHIFRVRGVRKLLSHSKARRGIAGNHAVELVRDVDPTTRRPSFERFSRYWRDITRPQDVFRVLLTKETFRPGLELTCPNCRLRAYIDADRIGHRVSCPLCGHSFLLAPLVTARDWVFRISGVFAREGGPQGAIPAILAMQELEAISIPDHPFIRVAHELSGEGILCESDLLALEVAGEGLASVCLGECKDQLPVEAEDVRRLSAVRSIIRSSGIECFLLFAVLRDAFVDEELRMFDDLNSEFSGERALGLPPYVSAPAPPPILFTARELEGEPWIPGRQNDGLPHPYPHSLRDLAENSFAIYLRNPEEGQPTGPET
jgi:hypothetical protein